MTIGKPPERAKRKKDHKQDKTFCWVCLHNPPYGKCLVCGYSVAKGDIDPKFANRFEWLQLTHRQLKKYNQRSTGNPDLDIEIYQKLSSWNSGMIPWRDPTTHKVVYLYYNQTPWELNPEVGGLEWDKLTEEDQKEITEDYTLPSDYPNSYQTWRRKYPRREDVTDAG